METLKSHGNDIFTVTGLNERIRDLLEDRFAYVRVRGELSDIHHPASGHIYFALVDGQSRIRAVIWRATRKRLTAEVTLGQNVVITGRIALYPPRGEYQLVVDAMQADGQGDGRARLLELHAKLASEGLFSQERKQSLPFFPKFIGIVTSSSGAALHDVIRVLDDRNLGYHLIVAAARVQGEYAAKEIVGALQTLIHDGRSQVIICGRGGGSTDDLAVFNDERVVRAVAASPIPVVSAVGHEVDLTLTDLAADLRAPTPSVAAQMVMPERLHLNQRLQQLKLRLAQGSSNLALRHTERLKRAANRLLHPRRRIEQYRFRCDELQERLGHAASLSVRRIRPELTHILHRLQLQPQNRLLLLGQSRTSLNQKRLLQEISKLLHIKTNTLAALVARLQGVSPMAVLHRGYAILFDTKTGEIHKSVETLHPGNPVLIRLADGELDATITHARKQPCAE